jgi:phasin family protein
MMEVDLSISQPFVLPFTKAIPDFQEILTLQKANVEALVQSNTALAKGIEAIGKHLVTLTQLELERSAAAAKAALAAKSLPDAIAVNTDYAKVSIEQLVANSTTLQELGAKVARDAVAPITGRVTVLAEAAGEAADKPVKSVVPAEKRAKSDS